MESTPSRHPYAAVIDQVGRVLGTEQFLADAAGTPRCWTGCAGSGRWDRSVEGTAPTGPGWPRLLRDQGVHAVEADRPDRKTRRFQGKSDSDRRHPGGQDRPALRADRNPQRRDGRVEALRNLRVARRPRWSTSGPDAQRPDQGTDRHRPRTNCERLRGLPVKELITVRAGLRPDRADAASPATAAKIALRSPARRHQQLSAEITDSTSSWPHSWPRSTPAWSPPTGRRDVAYQLPVTASYHNHDRLTSEAVRRVLAAPPRSPPRPARPPGTANRGGDRQANAAPTASCCAACAGIHAPAPTPNDAPRKRLSKKEIIRCLKRYIARELYQIITTNDLELAA